MAALPEAYSQVAKRYATAFYEYLKEEGADLKLIRREMEALKRLIETDKTFKLLIYSPMISVSLKEIFITMAIRNLSKYVKRLLRLLLRKRREGLLPEIISVFLKLASRRYDVIVIASEELPEELMREMRLELSKTLKSEVHLELEVDEDIMGGVILLLEDEMIDASLRRKLEAILQTLRESSWITISSGGG